MVTLKIATLADAVARWADERPCVATAYLYGSRVRGDHRSNSDVDVYVSGLRNGLSAECLSWWLAPEQDRFGALRAAINPLALHLGSSADDPAREWVQAAALDPARVVLKVRKVVCLWTPPKQDHASM